MIVQRRWGAIPARVGFVLVHGVMDRSASFNRLARRLVEATGVGAVSYDRRGYAESISAGPGSLDQHAGDLAEVIDTFDAERIVILGHSFGGTVAWHAVGNGLRPDLLATYEAPLPQLPGYRNDLADSTLAVASSDGTDAAVVHFARSVLGSDNWNNLRTTFQEARIDEGPAIVADLQELSHSEPLSPPVEVRRAVAYGELSGSYEAQMAAALAELLAVAPTVIDGASHGVHLTHPGACRHWLVDSYGS